MVRCDLHVECVGDRGDREALGDARATDVGLRESDGAAGEPVGEFEAAAHRLADRDRGGERARQVTVALHIFGSQRRLEEPGLPVVELPAECPRLAEPVRPVRVERDVEVGVDAADSVVGGEVGADVDAEVQLDAAYTALDELGRLLRALDVIDAADPRDVGRQHLVEAAAGELGHREAGGVTPEVPQCDVDGGHGVGLVTGEVTALAHRLGHAVPERAHRARVLADDERGEQVVDDRGRHDGGDRRQCLAPAHQTFVGLDLHEQGLVAGGVQAPPGRTDHVAAVVDRGVAGVGVVRLLLRQVEGEGLDARDSHRGLQRHRGASGRRLVPRSGIRIGSGGRLAAGRQSAANADAVRDGL